MRLLLFTIPMLLASGLYADDHRGFSATLRDCTELIGFGPVAFTQARSLVPASYTLVPFNGAAGLVVRASRCEGLRLNGFAERPTIVAQYGIAVVSRDGTGDINNYTIGYASDNAQLVLALRQAGVNAVLDLSLAYEFTVDSTGGGEVYAAVSPLLQPAWFLTGTAAAPAPTGAPVVANWWSQDGGRTVKAATAIASIRYGLAAFSLHTSRNSTLGGLIGGNTDSAFVFFNARGVFTTASFTVSVN